MAKKLRGYQSRFKAGIFDGWRAVTQHHGRAGTNAAVTATGSGKTVVMGNIAAELQSHGMQYPGLLLPNNAHGIVIAHRKELVGQISMAMAAEGLRHNLLASQATVKDVVHKHMHGLNASFYDPRATWTVASVDTLIARGFPAPERVGFAFTDEGHHVLAENKWGRAMQMFPNAYGLLMTATPCRADGMGLGRHHDGLADALVEGPGLAELMRDGYLVTYRVFKSKARDLDMSDVHVTSSGDYNQKENARAVKRSRQVIGDAVRIYQEHLAGKLAIVFAADVEHGDMLAEAFNAAGVPAVMVTGEERKGKESRDESLRKFGSHYKVVINVDLFGEGFDVPACDAVIMCRPTKSFQVYAQSIGRMLRLNISQLLMSMWDTFTVEQRLQHIAESSKPYGVLIDLVGNVGQQFKIGDYEYVGLPEGFAKWTLDRRTRARGPSDAIPVRKCRKCLKDYERTDSVCPFCGETAPEPAQRGTIQAVDGDVFELQGELLAQMRGNVLEALEGGGKVSDDWLASDPRTAGMARAAAQSKEASIRALMAHIDKWAASTGFDHAKNTRVFYYKFGMDVLTALSQTANKAAELSARISRETMNA